MQLTIDIQLEPVTSALIMMTSWNLLTVDANGTPIWRQHQGQRSVWCHLASQAPVMVGP